MDKSIINILKEIETELNLLGFNNKSISEVPDVINRIQITIRFAQLYYFEKHTLSESDQHWCKYYAHYVHFFDSDNYKNLGRLYYDLTQKMQRDNCFDGNLRR